MMRLVCGDFQKVLIPQVCVKVQPGNLDGSGTLLAGQDINLITVQTLTTVWDANNRRSDSQSADVGSQISGGGAVNLQAGQTLSATAANVQAVGALSVNAQDINIQVGLATQSVDEAHQHTSKGFLSKSTVTTRESNSSTTALGSNFGGDTVNITGNKDISIKGSNVVSDNGTTLNAGNSVTIEAAQNTSSSSSFRKETNSGLMSGGGLSISYGNQMQSNDGKD
jgi:filamentous hemagglutinin